MSLTSNYYIITIQRNLYSYGFELKDEGKPYQNYAIVSKITNNTASEKGLRVGNKVVSINGEDVSGKDYISLRNIIRNSIDDCVRLGIIQDPDLQMMHHNVINLPIQDVTQNQKLEEPSTPTVSIREKNGRFHDRISSDFSKRVTELSSSCNCLNKFNSNLQTREKNGTMNNKRASSLCLEHFVPDLLSSDSDEEIEVAQSISQDPFGEDFLRISQACVTVELPFNAVRVIDTKSKNHNEISFSLRSNDSVFDFISEPFEDGPLLGPEIPKLEMPQVPNFLQMPQLSEPEIFQTPEFDVPQFQSNYSITTSYNELSPDFNSSKSHSTNNIFQDVTFGLLNHLVDNKDFVEFGSMKNINRAIKLNFFGEKQITQSKFFTSAPIKLRIVQFPTPLFKMKSKGWKDYIIEPESNRVRFRKRSNKTTDFVIELASINRFEVDTPLRRRKLSANCDFNIEELFLKYNLAAFNNRIQIKFQFNPRSIQDNESSKRASEIYLQIIDSFKMAYNQYFHSIHMANPSQPYTPNLSSSEYQKNPVKTKEFTSSIEDIYSADYRNSASNSYKSTSKSSADNLSLNTFELSQSSSKSIFKQAMEKMKPEKRSKVPQNIPVSSGTVTEFEDYRNPLDGQLPMELDYFGEKGTNFNRYIYEVPRMNTDLKIPMIIYLCTAIIEAIGLKVEGIYRISGNQRVIRTLSSNLNKPLNDIEIHIPGWSNVHAVCSTLKLFLRKLKQYLIPADLSRVLAYSCKGVDCENARSLSKTLMDIKYHLSSYQIPTQRGKAIASDQVECHWRSLQYLLKHLSKVVSFCDFNKMDERAISVCFNPVIMESWQNYGIDIKADNEIMVKALELLLVHQDWLFSNWHSKMDNSWNSQLVENAEKYATDYVYRKYDFNIKWVGDEEYPDNKDIDIPLMVERTILQSIMTLSDKKILERRHSSHTPGQRPVILRDEGRAIANDSTDRRNSQTADALDLFTCANWMKQFAKVSIDEKKELKMSYKPSTNHPVDIFEALLSNEDILSIRKPLEVVNFEDSDEYDYVDFTRGFFSKDKEFE